MLSLKWILLFCLCFFSNVEAIPRILTPDIGVFVGAAGAVGFAGLVGWNLLRPSKTGNIPVQSHRDRVTFSGSSLLPMPTATPTGFEAPSIVKTVVSKGSTDVVPQSMCRSAVPMTRFFEVEAWSNGTIIYIEEIAGLRVGDLNNRYSNGSVSAMKETFTLSEELEEDNSQASGVSWSINIPEPQPPALNVSSSPWELAWIFLNVHADRKLRPVIESARRDFFIVLDFLNKALTLILKLVSTHPARAVFILVGVPLVTKFGSAVARRGLIMLSLYAPLIILLLQDNLDRYIGWYAGREEEPELNTEVATEPLPVEEQVSTPELQTEAPLDLTPAGDEEDSLPGEFFDAAERDNEESLPGEFLDSAEHLPSLGPVEASPLTCDPENYKATGIFKAPPASKVSQLSPSRKTSIRQRTDENQMHGRLLRDQLFGRRWKDSTSTAAQGLEDLSSRKALEEQAEPSHLQKPGVPTESHDQLQPAHLVAEESECTVTLESEQVPSPQSSSSIMPCSTDIPMFQQSHGNEPVERQLESTVSDKHDDVTSRSFPTGIYNDTVSTETESSFHSGLHHGPMPQPGQGQPAMYASEPTSPEGESIILPSETVHSPTHSNISSIPTEDDKKIEDDKDENGSPQGPGPSTRILEAIPEEEQPEESTDNSLHNNDGNSNDQACRKGSTSKNPLSPTRFGSAGGVAYDFGSALATAQERLKELTRPSIRGTDGASGATGDCTDCGTTEFGYLLDSNAPVSTPSKQPIVDVFNGTGGGRRGGLRSQTQAVGTAASRSERGRGVTFATESDGSVVNQTYYFQIEEAPVALRDSMVVDAQGQQATGVQVSTEQPPAALPDSMLVDAQGQQATGVQVSTEQPPSVVSASAGEQQPFNFVAPDPAPGYKTQAEEEPHVASQVTPAFFSALDSWSRMPADYRTQALAEWALGPQILPPVANTAEPEPIEAAEAAAEAEPSQSVPHLVNTDEILSASMSGLFLGQDPVNMDYEHDGPAHEVPFAQQVSQGPPVSPQSAVQEQAAAIALGYRPAHPVSMDSQQHDSAASHQPRSLEAQAHPVEMRDEYMADVAAVSAFDKGSTSDTPQASSTPAYPSIFPQSQGDGFPHSPLPGLDFYQQADLEAERRQRDEFRHLPQRNRATQYRGSDRKPLPMESVRFRCEPSQRSVFLRDSSQQTPHKGPPQPAETLLSNMSNAATPQNPGNQAFQSSDIPAGGTQSQVRAAETGQDSQHSTPSRGSKDDAQKESDATVDDLSFEEEDIQNQSGRVSQFPPLEDDVAGHAVTDSGSEAEFIAEGQGDSLDDEFDAAQLAYFRLREECEAQRRQMEEERGNAHPASGEQDLDEDEESESEEESDEEGREDPWGEDDEDEDEDEEEEQDNHGDGGDEHGGSGGSQQEQRPSDIEDFDDRDEDEKHDEDWSEDALLGEEDGFPCRDRIFRELSRLEQKVPQPFEIPEPTRIFVNRKQAYVHASVAKHIWWCVTAQGREWLFNNWDGIRKSHGWDMIERCQETVDRHEEVEAQREAQY
ncbi:uncharacterized protein A1O5_04645 [Cladophialophora psammophila CBS 110553]|uniref:Uncharacterized protein n=1 Tax=Cladophialophora psammophila CBS 110553 TaxID=1182543 RepID=W9X5D7_9EURO|nr:uncharacterized protein A1O5_04645 [Cladophialophora psammophila CBS 110553]EXJ72141.1 hypothetical protein A1O5_04645 [Cladophialophora psammophila CBS 110553]